jgi:hypothetical protein
MAYENEAVIGRVIKGSDVHREDIFLTTNVKGYPEYLDYDGFIGAAEGCLEEWIRDMPRTRHLRRPILSFRSSCRTWSPHVVHLRETTLVQIDVDALSLSRGQLLGYLPFPVAVICRARSPRVIFSSRWLGTGPRACQGRGCTAVRYNEPAIARRENRGATDRRCDSAFEPTGPTRRSFVFLCERTI